MDLEVAGFSVGTASTCEFCSQTFEKDSEKNFHMFQHFAYEICNDCDKRLIRIGDALYVLHTTVTCIKTVTNTAEFDPIPVERIVVKSEYEEQQNGLEFQRNSTNDVEIKLEAPDMLVEPIQQSFEQNENVVDIRTEHSIETTQQLNNLLETAPTNMRKKKGEQRCSKAERKEKRKIFKKKYDNELYQCDFEGCGKWIKRRQKYNHITQHRGIQFICHICKKSRATKEAIRRHMRNHIIEIATNNQNDIEAKAILEEEIRRKERLRYQENKLIKCEYDGCDKWIRTSAKRSHFKMHLRLENETFSCDICKSSFGNIKEIRAHMRVHSFHAVQKDPAIVSEMNSVPQSKEKETKHMIGVIYRETIIKCGIDECDKTFKRKDKDAHMIQYHGKQIICDICNASLKSESYLYLHKKEHLTESIECRICGKIMKKSNLRKHERIVHSNLSKNIICNVCGKAFRNNTALKEHLRVHTGEKPFPCSECDKSFRTTSLLRAHTRSHTGEKPCKCDQEGCDRAYAHYTDLKRHKYGAHGIWSKKFTCNVCAKDFPENKLLRYHMKSSHGVES